MWLCSGTASRAGRSFRPGAVSEMTCTSSPVSSIAAIRRSPTSSSRSPTSPGGSPRSLPSPALAARRHASSTSSVTKCSSVPIVFICTSSFRAPCRSWPPASQGQHIVWPPRLATPAARPYSGLPGAFLEACTVEFHAVERAERGFLCRQIEDHLNRTAGEHTDVGQPAAPHRCPDRGVGPDAEQGQATLVRALRKQRVEADPCRGGGRVGELKAQPLLALAEAERKRWVGAVRGRWQQVATHLR